MSKSHESIASGCAIQIPHNRGCLHLSKQKLKEGHTLFVLFVLFVFCVLCVVGFDVLDCCCCCCCCCARACVGGCASGVLTAPNGAKNAARSLSVAPKSSRPTNSVLPNPIACLLSDWFGFDIFTCFVYTWINKQNIHPKQTKQTKQTNQTNQKGWLIDGLSF